MAQNTESFRVDLQQTLLAAQRDGALDVPAGAHLEVIDSNASGQNKDKPQCWKVRLIGADLPLPSAEKAKTEARGDKSPESTT